MRSLAAVLLAASFSHAAEHHGVVTFGGLPLPGATVTATRAAEKLSAITDAQGSYLFPDLAGGLWTLRIEMLCFEPIQRDIDASETATWPMKLLPLAAIQATAKAAGVETVKVIAPTEPPPTHIASRPKKGAPPPAANTPGGFQKTDLKASAETPKPASDPAASDPELAQRAADGFLINGSANNGASSPFMLASAFGNQRKGSRSQYNASLGFILDNSALDARSYSLTGQDTARPAYNLLTGILAFGGPLKIPRLVRNGPTVIVNYQWTRNSNANTRSGLVPTLAERAGDFTLSRNPLDPARFPGGVIPQSRIDPAARTLLGLYPLPNFSGSSRYNYQIPIVTATHQDSLQLRSYRRAGRRDQLSGNFAMQSTRADNPNLFGFLDTSGITGINASFNVRHLWGQRFSTTLGYQFSRLVTRINPYFENRRNIAGEAGIAGNNQEARNWGPPTLSFAGGIATLNDAQASLTRNQTSGLSIGNLWSRDRHNVSFGGDIRRQQFNLLSQQDPRGTFTFTGAAAGNDFAGFLLGVPDTAAIAFGNADKYFRAWSDDAFITDDWRVNPGLTINAGVRWEYGSPISELFGRLVNLNVAPGFAAVAPVVAAQSAGPLLQPDRHAFQPRIGISWRPFSASSTVVRAGYGVTYDTSVYLPIATQMAQQSPLSKSLSVQNSPDRPLTLENGLNASAATPNTFGVDPNLRVGNAQNWQISIQRDLPAALVLTATYLGAKGTRALQAFLPNTYPTGAFNPCVTCPAGFIYVASNGNSKLESGQVQLRRRLQSGLTASVQYTFSKAIDDAAAGARVPGSWVIAQDWRNLSGERGLSSFDQRHLLSVQAQYTSGMGVRGGTLVNGWRGALLKEWTIATQITAGSGLPLTPVYVAAVNGTGITGSIRPDYTGAPVYDAPAGLALNPAAYAAPAGHWGNAGRNSIIGPAQFAAGASLGRTFRLSDRVSLDLRIDAANALNHVTYPNWNTNITSAQFGLPTTANAMRTVQTTLRARF